MLTANLEKRTLIAYGREIPISCDVRNELNGWRPKSGEKDVFRTIPHELPSMPRQFPKGTWRVGRPEARSNPYLAPYYIPTDAHQRLEVWELKDGFYSKPTGVFTVDRAYGLHHSTSGTTQGCIKILLMADLLWLVDQIKRDIDNGNVVYLTVE